MADTVNTAQAPSDSATFAYEGSQVAGSTAHPFNTTDLHVEGALSLVRTAHPAKVVRGPYDPATGNDIMPGTIGPIGVVDVQPLVNQVDGNNNSTPHGTVYRIPYHRYQSASGAFISDPVKGDVGEIIVHDRDTSVVRSTGAQANPGSRRRHDLADGVYHGQVISGAPSQYWGFTADGLVAGDKNGNVLTSDKDGWHLNGVTITPDGDVVTKSGIHLGTHVHTGVTTGFDETRGPV